MEEKDQSKSKDQSLSVESKKMKSKSVTNAILIGFMIGVVIYSIFNGTLGLVVLIPLLFALGVFNKPKKQESLEDQHLK